MSRSFTIRNLGRLAYGDALTIQKELQSQRIEGDIEDTILFVEHPAVVTLGRAANAANVVASRAVLQSRGIDVVEVGRGGDVTYHGPGQVVMYPIIDLKPDRKDVRKYVWSLEEAMVRTCGDFDLEAGRIAGLNGTWIGDRKIGAVGVRISRWVTMHGLALNVNTDLSDFELIVPCGITDKTVTSLQAELKKHIDVDGVRQALTGHFARLYDASVAA